jgi:DNA-binding NarL/FixJ family response regulator
MNILIADHLWIYRFGIKSIFLEKWPKALVYEARSFEEMFELVHNVNFDLLILDIEMLGGESQDDFIAQTTYCTKILTLSGLEQTDHWTKIFQQLGANAVIYRYNTKEHIVCTAEFLLTS